MSLFWLRTSGCLPFHSKYMPNFLLILQRNHRIWLLIFLTYASAFLLFPVCCSHTELLSILWTHSASLCTGQLTLWSAFALDILLAYSFHFFSSFLKSHSLSKVLSSHPNIFATLPLLHINVPLSCLSCSSLTYYVFCLCYFLFCVYLALMSRIFSSLCFSLPRKGPSI